MTFRRRLQLARCSLSIPLALSMCANSLGLAVRRLRSA